MKVNDDHLYLPTENGQFVSEKQRRIAEILKDYDPYLQLQWIPPDERNDRDMAFRVVDVKPGKPPYVVLVADSCDERLLARVLQCDQKNGSTLSYLEHHNNALELYNLKKRKEANSEATELAHGILHSKKINYRHNGINFGTFNGRR